MSRRGNCYENAVAESFFSSLKIGQLKKRINQTWVEAKTDIFDYIEGLLKQGGLHATSISINSAPTSSSGSIKLRYEICLAVWGNATDLASALVWAESALCI